MKTIFLVIAFILTYNSQAQGPLTIANDRPFPITIVISATGTNSGYTCNNISQSSSIVIPGNSITMYSDFSMFGMWNSANSGSYMASTYGVAHWVNVRYVFAGFPHYYSGAVSSNPCNGGSYIPTYTVNGTTATWTFDGYFTIVRFN